MIDFIIFLRYFFLIIVLLFISAFSPFLFVSIFFIKFNLLSSETYFSGNLRNWDLLLEYSGTTNSNYITG